MKRIMIRITLTGDSMTLDGENINELTKDDIVGSIKMLVSLAKMLGIMQKEGSTNENA